MSGPAAPDLIAGAGPARRYAPVSGIEWIGLLLALGAVLAPFCFVTYPPLHDYPFHLARIQILHSLGSGEYFDRIYSFNSWLLPNVAMDFVLYGLVRHGGDVQLAGLLLVAAVQVFTVGGVAFLRWTLQRRFGLAPLLAAIVAHNWIFLFGFVNYLIGLALFLWCFALWIHQMDAALVPRLMVGAFAAAMLFFCHFLAFSVFALAVFAFELQHAIANRQNGVSAVVRLAVSGLPLLAPLMIFVLLTPTSGEAGPDPLGDWYRSLEFSRKPLHLVHSLLSGNIWVDFATIGLACGLAIGAGWLLAKRGARFQLDRRLCLPLTALCLLPLLAPPRLFSAFFIDYRLLLPFVYVAIAAARLELPPQRWRTLAGIGVAIVVAGRAAAFSAIWSTYEGIGDQYMAAFRALPRPATLYVAFGEKSPVLRKHLGLWSDRWNPPLKHVVSLASLAGDIYVPATWAHPSQQPIVVRERYRASYQLQGANPIAISRADDLLLLVKRIRIAHHAGAHPPGSVLILLLYPGAVENIASFPGAPIASGQGFIVLNLPMDGAN